MERSDEARREDGLYDQISALNRANRDLEAENERLKATIQNALVSLAIVTMPTMDNDVMTNEELLKVMGDSFREILKGGD